MDNEDVPKDLQTSLNNNLAASLETLKVEHRLLSTLLVGKGAVDETELTRIDNVFNEHAKAS